MKRLLLASIYCMSLFLPVTLSLECFVDLQGVKRHDDEPEEQEQEFPFEIKDCITFNPSSTVEKPCMTKTDKNGIVTRNCATNIKKEEVCEEDSDRNMLCFCLSNLCNKSQTNFTQQQQIQTLILMLSLALTVTYWQTIL